MPRVTLEIANLSNRVVETQRFIKEMLMGWYVMQFANCRNAISRFKNLLRTTFLLVTDMLVVNQSGILDWFLDACGCYNQSIISGQAQGRPEVFKNRCR